MLWKQVNAWPMMEAEFFKNIESFYERHKKIID